jgi:ABC-type polysaccharide/polyol phosphate export permease
MSRLLHDVQEMLHEQIEYRELLWRITARDLLLRYKQTVMGFAWAIFMPLLNTLVFSIIFMRVAKIDSPVAYPVYAYCGLWVWNLFASSLRFSVVSLTGNPSLVSKVYFPREIFPFASVLVCFVDFAVASIPLIVLMIVYDVRPSSTIMFLPVVLIVHLAFTAAVALLLAMANLFYRDVKYLFELVLMVWMFVSSVLYPIELVGGRLATLVQLNPMTPIIDAYRAALLGVPMHNPAAFAGAAALSAVLLIGAWLTFHRLEYEFAENL